ncbi:hypothetical protein LZV53_10030 [Klebsiella michiganensis]|uniref:hypothetical protein n=1 Tax=Klebsiella michiganensis TaxID=1134687 RepID=UPI001F434E93|nr:hypothetical protein [Klebsiella michiganensis]MCE7544889.1 hypothetical protein [Klebsiella michiganensis]
MKELTIGEMESISGGFNVFGSIANSISSISSISSIINNTASHLSDFITSAGATIANAIVNDTIAFGDYLSGTSTWQDFVASSNENWSNSVHDLSGEWNTFTNSITA